MKLTELPQGSVPDLLGAYEHAAIAHGLATAASNPRLANKAHSVLAGAYRELRARGLAAQRALLPLLTHENEWVQSWAAAHALEFEPTQAEEVLERLARGTDMCAFNCRTVLSEWRKGRLAFP